MMHYSLRNQVQEVFESYGTEEQKPVVADADSGFKAVLEPKPEGTTEEVVEKSCDPKDKKKPMMDGDGEDSEDSADEMSEDDKKKMKEQMQKAEPRFAALALDHQGALPVKKFNPHHGPDGRFTTAGAAAGQYLDGLEMRRDPNRGDVNPNAQLNDFLRGRVGSGGDKDHLTELVDAFGDGEKRNLNYLHGKDMDVSEWASAMDKATPGGYNEFNAQRVAKVLAKYPGIKVRPAREYSVAAYVTGSEDTLYRMAGDLKRSRSLRADEVDLYKPGHEVRDRSNYSWDKKDTDYPLQHKFTGSVLRIWWD